MRSVSFLEQDNDFLNRWEQYMEQFPKVNIWFVIYDTSWEDERKINKVVTFSLCPATLDLEKLKHHLEENLVTDIKSCSHVPSKTIQFLKNDPQFFSISFVIKNMEESIPLNGIQDLLHKMEMRVHNVSSEPEKRRLRKLKDLNVYVNRKKCDIVLLNKLFLISYFLSFILEFLTLFQNAKKAYWFPDRETEVLYKDKILLDLAYLVYCDMMEKHHASPLVLRGCIADPNEKKYPHDALTRYPDYIAGVLASVDLETGQGGEEKHQLLWQHAICNNSRMVVFKIDAGSLSNTPLTLPCVLDKRKI